MRRLWIMLLIAIAVLISVAATASGSPKASAKLLSSSSVYNLMRETERDRYGLFSLETVLASGGNVTTITVQEKFNAHFSSWIEEADYDRYGFLTPGDILAADIRPSKKSNLIKKYFESLWTIDMDGNPKTDDVISYSGSDVTSVMVRDGDRLIPVFSMDISDRSSCFVTYPSDHYRIFIEPKLCSMITYRDSYIGTPAGLPFDEYNVHFKGWIHETDGDEVGILSPGDILMSWGTRREKAAKIQRYFSELSTLDLDGDPDTIDVWPYIDGTTMTVVVSADGVGRYDLFSMSIGEIDNCNFRYFNDHSNPVRIGRKQCGLIRTAHPFLQKIGADDLDPENWIDTSDERVLVGADELSNFNAKLIGQANEIWTELFPGAPMGLWDIKNLPSNLKFRDVIGDEIRIRKYPFTRGPATAGLTGMTEDQLLQILKSTQIPGDIKIDTDEESGKVFAVLSVEDSYADGDFEPVYGWVVKRTDMRAVPSHDQALFYATDDDHWQYTGVNAEQPVVIIGEASDKSGGRWYHILTTRVRGWVSAKDVAVVSRNDVKKLASAEVVTVVAPTFELAGRVFEAGTRLRVAGLGKADGDYVVALSNVDSSGKLTETNVRITSDLISNEISGLPLFDGVVPFSRANFTRLIFRYLGTPWAMAGERRGDTIEYQIEGGNREFYIDCSGIMANAFSAMGITGMARNSWLQSNQGKTLWLKDDAEKRTLPEALDEAGHDAWLIGMFGHVTFYLGKNGDGEHMILHSPGHFRDYTDDENYIRIGDGRAIISKLSFNNLDQRYSAIMSPVE